MWSNSYLRRFFSGQRALSSRCGYFGEEKTLWPLPRLGTWFSSLLARGLFTVLTTLSLHTWKVYRVCLCCLLLWRIPDNKSCFVFFSLLFILPKFSVTVTFCRLRDTKAYLSCNVPAVSSPRAVSVCHHCCFYRIFYVKGKRRSLYVVMYLHV